MGTIRKVNGEFYYRKDGKVFKFLNQDDLKKRYPSYEDPIFIEDENIMTFSADFLDLAAFKAEAIKFDVFADEDEETEEAKVQKTVDLMNKILLHPKTLNEIEKDMDYALGGVRMSDINKIVPIPIPFPHKLDWWSNDVSYMPADLFTKEDLKKAFMAGERFELTFDEFFRLLTE